MPTTVNSLNGNERQTGQIKKGTKSSAASAPCPETTGILLPLRCPQHFQKPNYPPAENQRRLGLIICATELDMISRRHQQDYGKHDDGTRAAYHHETGSHGL